MNVEHRNEYVGNINIPILPKQTEVTRTSLIASSRLLPPHSVLLTPRFSPYGTLPTMGTSGPMVPNQHNRVIHGIRQPVAPTIGKNITCIQEQVSTATIPLTAQVAQTSQIVQQTSALAREALHQVQVAKETSAQVRGDVENVLRVHMS